MAGWTNEAVEPTRVCLRCGKDLTNVMGCYVFAGGKAVDGLLCVSHGANGANSLSIDEYNDLLVFQSAVEAAQHGKDTDEP